MTRHLIATLCLALALTPGLLAQDAMASETTLLVAEILGLEATRIEQAETHTVSLRALGVTVTLAKAFDRERQEVVSRSVDALGRDVDFPRLRAQELIERERQPRFKLDPALEKHLQIADGDALLRLGLWLHFPAERLEALPREIFRGADLDDRESVRAAEAAMTDALMTENARLTSPVVATLAGMGIVPHFVSTSAPVVFVTVAPDRIPDLAGMAAVDTVYLETLERTESNVDAHATHRTDRVHSFGVKGRGVRVAVLENNGIDPACPWLNVQGWHDAAAPNPDDHVHGTAGCVASTRADRIGAAPDVELFSANAASYSDADVMAAGDWIASQNIDITNMSFSGNTSGSQDLLTRYFEYQSRYYQDSYVASAGNDGNTGSPYVGAPGIAYNLITVGSFGNADTGDWADDTMSGFSSWWNPASSCEKPNLAGVGETIHTLADGTVNAQGTGCPGLNQPSPWLMENYCGTSFSSPLVAGNLANAFVVDSTLAVYPEAAMALSMATAWHNIEGSSRLSSQDGAGGLQGVALYRAARAGHAIGTTLTASDFAMTGYYVRSLFLQGGDRTRICLAWSSQADASYTTATLDANFDIAIYPGFGATGGTLYASSSSLNNNFEIVEFTPPATGWYSVRINDTMFASPSERVGLAWSQKQTDGPSARLREFTQETSAVSGPTIGQASYYMDVIAPNSPSASFIAYPGGTMTAGLQFSPWSWAPVDYDAITQLWFDGLSGGPSLWTGSAWALDASGQFFNHRLFIPDFTPIVGFPLHHVGAIVDPAAPNDGIKEITEVHSFDFWPAANVKTRSDDGNFVQSLPFGFNFYGNTYTQCWVNMNGNVTFTGSDSDWTPSGAEMLSQEPRIAAMWTDLAPNLDGSEGTPIVRVREIFQGNQKVVIEFINVPFRMSSTTGEGDNTFRITLADDNSITLEWRECERDTCLVGISPGNGLSTQTELDLTSYGDFTGGNDVALYEQFTGGSDPMDLNLTSGDFGYNWYYTKLRFEPTSASATAYRVRVDVD